MNTIIERFLIPLFFVLSILYVFNSLTVERIELKKIFHHTTDDDLYLEKGTLALYFSHEPQVKEIDKPARGVKAAKSFFFPNAMISSVECEEMINRINKYSAGYSVAIEKTEKPEKGITVTFMITADKIAIEYDFFDSIGLQKGIAFRLYNKEVINKLHKNNPPLLRTLWHTGKPRVAIDFGHGGSDCGAVSNEGIQEKNVCLAVGTTVAQLLEKSGYSVVLTRNSDADVLLDQRTSFANNNHADLLVSIHANSAPNSTSRGIETFCMRPSECKRISSYLSAQEKEYVNQITHNMYDSSYKLATSIQTNVCQLVKHDYADVVDRKVKYAVAQLLLGTRMPSVLVEVGFLSHDEESRLLNDQKYQAVLAQGIVNGIMAVLPLQSLI